jgi:hypothetical protein
MNGPEWNYPAICPRPPLPSFSSFAFAGMPTDLHKTIRISRLGWLVIGAALLLPWGIVVWTLGRSSSQPVTHTAKAVSAAAKNEAVTAVQPGPWGNLEYSRIAVEPPEDYIPFDFTKPDKLRWVFKGYTEEKLAALWQKAQLKPAQLAFLNDPARRQATANAIAITPDENFVIDLMPTARTAIYAALSEFEENPSQNAPFRLRADAASLWFEKSGLSPEILQLTQKLLYQRDNYVFFSDEDVVLPHIASTTERVRFLKTLARKNALLVQLVVSTDTNAAALAHYWGRGRRSKDLEPLLESIARRPQGGAIDIVHLLPPFPRALLYTYPVPSQSPADATHDCHWTALNFFNERADERFADIDFVKKTLLEDYFPAVGPPLLGDIFVFVRADGVVVHSCVYVAGDIVFTKNGSSFSVPWTMGTLDSVVTFYSLNAPVEVRRLRKKEQ